MPFSAIKDYQVSGSCTYAPLETAQGYRLLSTKLTVLCSGFSPALRLVNVSTDSLPFGFLESVTLTPTTSATRPLPKYRLHLMKTTGQCESEPTTRPTTSVVYGVMNKDQDAADEDLRAVKTLTGHDLRFRCIAASSVVSLGIEFYDAPPEEFTLEYNGMNVVADADVTAAVADLKRVKVLYPPIPARRRLQNTRSYLERAMQEESASEEKSVSASAGACGDGGCGRHFGSMTTDATHEHTLEHE